MAAMTDRANSPLEAHRLGKELHERCRRCARFGKQIHELRRADFLARELCAADEVLALEILDHRMLGTVALRWTRQHVAHHFESRLEFTIVDGALPFRGPRDDRVA